MFQHILVPVDLSDRHGAALEQAANLCLKPQGEIVLLHVIEEIPGLESEEIGLFYARLERVARERLRRLGEKLEGSRVRWRQDVRLGHRLAQVIACAEEIGADLIVLTNPPVDPEQPLSGLGSLSIRISITAPCPVLLVREDDRSSEE